MPDIDPAALSRPSVTQTTPVLKTITVSSSSLPKVTKSSHFIPARIELEPLYTALKHAIGPEQWPLYKESISKFMLGQLNQQEYSDRIDPILTTLNGDRFHLHNQLIAAIYGNLTREMPDLGLAPWVSANDKPAANSGAKPVTGDAAERRLKGDVMQLPSRDRRRIKDLVHNDFDPFESMANMFAEHHRGKTNRAPDVPQSAAGLNKMNLDLEIRKRFNQPLAVESGEFPDHASIESRMLPICYENGLVGGHTADATQYLSVAAETYIKEFLSTVFRRTRSNGPGDSNSAGFGSGANWIQTHKYKKQLRREEGALARGELSRDKAGLLPVEARAAGERGPLDMADLRLALELGDCGIATIPDVTRSIIFGYREGELDHWNNYTYVPDQTPAPFEELNLDAAPMTNGFHDVDAMDVDTAADPYGWDGGESQDVQSLDNILDACLAV
ncbi:transcriptional coactivator HFI1/ADA1 [Microdochium nivale]|nr:transcriptional coactivator HFI1/ADA1 [Microdochium nivale]